MRKHLTKLSLIATLAIAFLVGNASSARADLIVRVSLDGAAFTTIASTASDFTSVNFTGNLKVVLGSTVATAGVTTANTVGLSVSSASADNDLLLSDLLSSTNSVRDNSTGGSHVIVIQTTQSNYTLPGIIGSKVVMDSGIGGSTAVGALGQDITYQGYFDNSNALFGIPGDATTTLQTVSPSPAAVSTWDSGRKNVTVTRTTAMYSLSSTTTVTVGAGGRLNYAASTIVTPVPAPAGVILALSGAPLLTLGCWLRRRQVGLKTV